MGSLDKLVHKFQALNFRNDNFVRILIMIFMKRKSKIGTMTSKTQMITMENISDKKPFENIAFKYLFFTGE